MFKRLSGVTLVFCTTVILTAGVGLAEDLANSSRIQNLEVDLVNETATRILVDNSLQDQIDNIELIPGPPGPQGNPGPQGPQGPAGPSGEVIPTSGYVSVPLMPTWTKYGAVKRAYSYDPTPGDYHHHNMNGAYADTSVRWNGWMNADPIFGSSTKYYIPVQLPDGAVITSFHFWAYDNDPTNDGRVIFRKSGPTTGGAGYSITMPPSLYTSGTGDVPRKFTAGAIKPSMAVVDNSKYSYNLEVKLWSGTDVVAMSAVVGYGYNTDPTGGGEVNYSGSWDFVNNVFQDPCGETGEMLSTLDISHAGNEIIFYPEEGDPLIAELIGNTVIEDTVDPGTGDAFRLGLTFTSADTFEGQFVERWSNGDCFQRTTITGSRQ